MKKTLPIFLCLCMIWTSSCSQQQANNKNNESSVRNVGGSCEGCEAVFEYGSKKLNSIDTLPDFKEPGPKLEISGIIYQRDGKTPARDVILYVYHTDQKGEYSRKGNESGWGKRHGYIRGWIKTGADGRYKFYTLKPAAYPGGDNPAHIHATIKEPGVKEYWIDEYLFDNDPILTSDHRKSQANRCGNGILVTKAGKNEMLIAERDLVLGLNIPNYD